MDSMQLDIVQSSVKQSNYDKLLSTRDLWRSSRAWIGFSLNPKPPLSLRLVCGHRPQLRPPLPSQRPPRAAHYEACGAVVTIASDHDLC